MSYTIPLKSQDVTKVATTSASFLKLEVGPRPASLAGAYVALADDPSTLAWNPAGMSNTQKPTVASSYTKFYAGISHFFFAYLQPINPSNYIGLSVIHLNSGSMEVTTEEFDRGTGETFSVSDFVLGLSVARNMTDFLTLGLTVKYIREQIYREVAHSVAFDVGSYFDTGLGATILGMSVTNFGTEMKLDGPDLVKPYTNPTTGLTDINGTKLATEKWPLPLTFKMGIRNDLIGGINKNRPTENHRLTFVADATDPVDHTLRVSLGLEYEWLKIVSIRMGKKYNGWKRDSFKETDEPAFGDENSVNARYIEYPVWDEEGRISLEGLAFGAGINLGFFRTDYALSNFGLLGFVHQIGLQLQF